MQYLKKELTQPLSIILFLLKKEKYLPVNIIGFAKRKINEYKSKSPHLYCLISSFGGVESSIISLNLSQQLL